MANIKSAKKRILVNDKKNLRNRSIKSALKTTVKKFNAAVAEGNKELAASMLPGVISAVDKAAAKGIMHKNAANRKRRNCPRLQCNAETGDQMILIYRSDVLRKVKRYDRYAFRFYLFSVVYAACCIINPIFRA